MGGLCYSIFITVIIPGVDKLIGAAENIVKPQHVCWQGTHVLYAALFMSG